MEEVGGISFMRMMKGESWWIKAGKISFFWSMNDQILLESRKRVFHPVDEGPNLDRKQE